MLGSQQTQDFQHKSEKPCMDENHDVEEHAQIMKHNMKNLVHFRLHVRTQQYNMVPNGTSSLDILDTGVNSCLSCLVLRGYHYRTPTAQLLTLNVLTTPLRYQ